MKGLELQQKTRARIIQTKRGHALSIQFKFGPLTFFIIAGLPRDLTASEGPLCYVKVNTVPSDDWPVFKDHGNGD